MYIHWSADLETGQPLMDAEHRMLLLLFRRMDVAIKTEVDEAALHPILAEVRRFVRFHFLSEENLMRESGYPRQAEHEAQHQHLLVELDLVAQRVLTRSEFPEDMLYFLNDWLGQHIARHDRDIARHLEASKQRPIAESAYADYLLTPAPARRADAA